MLRGILKDYFYVRQVLLASTNVYLGILCFGLGSRDKDKAWTACMCHRNGRLTRVLFCDVSRFFVAFRQRQ